MRVETQVTIAAPPERVADYVTDVRNLSSWYGHVSACNFLGPAPLQAGTRLQVELEFLGRTWALTYAIEELVPNTLLRMHGTAGALNVQTTYLWQRVEPGTRLRLRHDIEAKGAFGFAAPLARAALHRANTSDLERLKRILERS